MSKLIMCHVLHTYLTPNCFFSGCVLWLNDTSYSKSKEVNRKFPARKTTVQLLTPYTDAKRHNAQH